MPDHQTSPVGEDAERAAFEAWHCSKFATKHSTGQPTRDMHNGIYAENYGPEHQQQMWEAWQAAGRRAAPALDASGLPPLPEPIEVGGEGWNIEDFQSWKTFTVDDMEQYARDAVAADRASRVSADQWAALEAARLQLDAAKERRSARQGYAAPTQPKAQVGTIDTPEFRDKLLRVLIVYACEQSYAEPRADLISYIDAWAGSRAK